MFSRYVICIFSASIPWSRECWRLDRGIAGQENVDLVTQACFGVAEIASEATGYRDCHEGAGSRRKVS